MGLGAILEALTGNGKHEDPQVLRDSYLEEAKQKLRRVVFGMAWNDINGIFKEAVENYIDIEFQPDPRKEETRPLEPDDSSASYNALVDLLADIVADVRQQEKNGNYQKFEDEFLKFVDYTLLNSDDAGSFSRSFECYKNKAERVRYVEEIIREYENMGAELSYTERLLNDVKQHSRKQTHQTRNALRELQNAECLKKKKGIKPTIKDLQEYIRQLKEDIEECTDSYNDSKTDLGFLRMLLSDNENNVRKEIIYFMHAPNHTVNYAGSVKFFYDQLKNGSRKEQKNASWAAVNLMQAMQRGAGTDSNNPARKEFMNEAVRILDAGLGLGYLEHFSRETRTALGERGRVGIKEIKQAINTAYTHMGAYSLNSGGGSR